MFSALHGGAGEKCAEEVLGFESASSACGAARDEQHLRFAEARDTILNGAVRPDPRTVLELEHLLYDRKLPSSMRSAKRSGTDCSTALSRR